MKAILVVDIPKCCEECRLINSHYDNEYGWQTYCGADYHRIREKNKKIFCPLKPMPQELPTPYMMRQIQIAEGIQIEKPPYTEEYQKGYNDCIGEILKETDDRNI